MNKLRFIALYIVCTSIFALAAESKKQKIENLFELVHNKQAISKVVEPIFANFNVADAKIKQTAMDRYFDTIKKEFVSAYDKFFNDKEIDEMLKYNRSAAGKKFNSISFELNAELQKAYQSIVSIIQELTQKQENPSTNKSTAVLHFDDIAKGKSDKEIRNLFIKELQHDGLTIVKFSASWCGPCKSYVPVFEEVASKLKEITINGKKVGVKYIATDIGITKVIGQDNSVTSIPTTIFYKNGKKIDSQTGYMTPDALSTRIKGLAK